MLGGRRASAASAPTAAASSPTPATRRSRLCGHACRGACGRRSRRGAASSASRPASRSLSKLNSASCRRASSTPSLPRVMIAGVGRVAVGHGEEGRQQLARVVRAAGSSAGGPAWRSRARARAGAGGARRSAPVMTLGHSTRNSDLLELAARVAPGAARRRGRRVEAGDDGRPARLVARRSPPTASQRRRRSRRPSAIVAGPPRKRCPWLTSPAREAVQVERRRCGRRAWRRSSGPGARSAGRCPRPSASSWRSAGRRRAGPAMSGTSSSSGAALAADLGEDELAPAVLAHHEVGDRDALAAGEALGGLGGGAVGAEGGRRGRAAHRAAWWPPAPRAARSPWTAKRRGATETRRPRRPAQPERPRGRRRSRPGACSTISRHALEGSSSQPTSIRRSGTGGLRAPGATSSR